MVLLKKLINMMIAKDGVLMGIPNRSGQNESPDKSGQSVIHIYDKKIIVRQKLLVARLGETTAGLSVYNNNFVKRRGTSTQK